MTTIQKIQAITSSLQKSINEMEKVEDEPICKTSNCNKCVYIDYEYCKYCKADRANGIFEKKVSVSYYDDDIDEQVDENDLDPSKWQIGEARGVQSDDDDEFKEEREEYEREIAYVKMMKDAKENNKKKWLCLNGRFRS